MELTGLEICKRIAEIEGLMFEVAAESLFLTASELSGSKNKNHWSYEYSDYNPLKDDALCFQLMKKYKIDVVWVSSLLDKDNRAYAKNTALSNLVNEKPKRDVNKAICLAIIEAHKNDWTTNSKINKRSLWWI